ncbi:MAG: hypothetical protein ACOX6L_11860 [Syntrophomonadaceae bacterium]|jgi:hypothetical protein
MADQYNSIGHHPKSTYMTSEGYALHNISGLDLIIDIAGVYFPLRSINYAANHNVTDEHGTGTHDPVALTNQEHTYTGTFTYASFLVNGYNVLTTEDKLILTQLLQDQADEGVSKYFDIYIIEVQGKRTPGTGTTFEEQIEAALQNESMVGYINALVDCKVTKVNRDIPEKNTVVSSREFKYSYMLPR